ncbi:NADPH-dependent FMN reductase [Streptomyces sp. 3MP-14]|uniref:NADPH-dependent FMN reductase n=1 Tax=Streptomyces mimosae TaxID=2586635 RepID=A0A5N5ZZ86_9ACTN|nr:MULTISPECIES: NAD(P)H-dependent oxidoreductase [Streptomyces]KAB8161791.1 NADPH-dependent FMN reductase [Streptomyces mimosae]KAB8174941.1 NADPH-dependent FMN reductase [Streptomyces sp. 3MP-14]
MSIAEPTTAEPTTVESAEAAVDANAQPGNDADRPLRLAVILGSVRDGRFGPTVADWFTGHAEERAGGRGDVTVDRLDLADVPLPLDMSRGGGEVPSEASEALASTARRLAAADAFVVITPEYNHSFPAALKNLIDWHFSEWQAKPVGFVSYGGVGGGLRAVEQLRGVFAELHAVTVRRAVSFHYPWNWFDESGHPGDPAACAEAVDGLLDQLVWWGRALRSARDASPYAA